MQKNRTTYLAYGTLSVAIIVWATVIYFAYNIHNKQVAYDAQVANTIQESNRTASGARLHTLAGENLARLASLDAVVSPDVASIINTINSVGTASGVPIKISAALPGILPKNQKDIHAVIFIIEGTGSLAALMHTLKLFEVLPVAASIDTVDLSQVSQPASQNDATIARPTRPWRMNLKMQVLTTAPVSL